MTDDPAANTSPSTVDHDVGAEQVHVFGDRRVRCHLYRGAGTNLPGKPVYRAVIRCNPPRQPMAAMLSAGVVKMEVLIISLMFVSIALVGCMFALLLIVRAVRCDIRDEAAATGL